VITEAPWDRRTLHRLFESECPSSSSTSTAKPIPEPAAQSPVAGGAYRINSGSRAASFALRSDAGQEGGEPNAVRPSCSNVPVCFGAVCWAVGEPPRARRKHHRLVEA
jgi:hypothetical protein